MKNIICLFACLLFFCVACTKDEKKSTDAKPNALLKSKTYYRNVNDIQAMGQIEYEYDSDGKLIKLTDKGTESPNTFTYFDLTYYKDGRLDTHIEYASNGGQSTGYKYVRGDKYIYQEGRLNFIMADGILSRIYAYDKKNQLIQIDNLNKAGLNIVDTYNYVYDDAGVLIKESYHKIGVGLIYFKLFSYFNGMLQTELINKDGKDSSILYEYKGSLNTKITYLNLFKEVVRRREFQYDSNRNKIFESWIDMPRGWADNTHIVRFEYYP